MAGRIPDAFIDELLVRIDIVDVIERRVPLKKAGHEWSACCPFHDERTPSFTVSPQKQFYHCFGCGAHGSAIKFLMDYEHLEFPDAVEELAQSVSLTVPHEAGEHGVPRAVRTDLYDLLESAASYFEQALKRSDAAQGYCRERGLDADTIARFRIGYAPKSYDSLLRQLGTTPAHAKLLEEAGMLARGDRGVYDRFRERLMFPIMDRRGRVIAFGGRLLEGDGPKYLNSPETPLFHKGRELFALWQVKQANTQLKRLLVVEGYMDVIALHQAELPIAVATLGTATTAEHAERLLRGAPDVIFGFDGDRAGRAAAWRALESVLPHLRDGRQAWFLFLPDGEDPDSLVRKEGKAGFEARLQAATPLSDYFFATLGHDIDLASLDGRARLAERSRPLLARLPAGTFRDLMLQELSRRTGATVQVAAAQRITAQRTRAAPRRSLIRSAITLLLQAPELAREVPTPYVFADLQTAGIDLLIELLDVARQRDDMSTAMLLHHFDGREQAEALAALATTPLQISGEAVHREFVDALRQLQRQTLVQRIDHLIEAQASRGLDDAEKSQLRELLAAKSQPA